MNRTTGQRLRSVTVPYVGLRAIGQAIEFVGWVLLARRLAPAGLGQLAVAFLLFRYAGLVADWGAIGRGARDVASKGRHGAVSGFVRFRTRLSLTLGAAAALSAIVTNHADVAPVAVLVLSIGMNRDWIALGKERGVRAGAPIVLQGVVIAAGAVVASTTSEGAFVVAAGYGASLVVSIALNRLSVEDDLGSSTRPDHWLLVALLANQANSTLDIVLLGALTTSAEAGIYSAVYRFPNAFIALLGSVIGAFLPIATATRHEDEAKYEALERRAMIVSATTASLVVVAMPVLYLAVPIVLDAAYEPGRGPLLVLTLATAVVTLTSPLHSILIARGRDRTYATITATGAAVNVGLNLLLIPTHQMMGAAFATLATQALISLMLVYAVRSPRASPG